MGAQIPRPDRVPVRLQLEGKTQRVEAIWGTVVNLSANGMLVELGFPLPPGTNLDFSFQLPGDDAPVDLDFARVVSVPVRLRHALEKSLEGFRQRVSS